VTLSKSTSTRVFVTVNTTASAPPQVDVDSHGVICSVRTPVSHVCLHFIIVALFRDQATYRVKVHSLFPSYIIVTCSGLFRLESSTCSRLFLGHAFKLLSIAHGEPLES